MIVHSSQSCCVDGTFFTISLSKTSYWYAYLKARLASLKHRESCGHTRLIYLVVNVKNWNTFPIRFQAWKPCKEKNQSGLLNASSCDGVQIIAQDSCSCQSPKSEDGDFPSPGPCHFDGK